MRTAGTNELGLPRISPFVRNVLVTLFVMYVIELFVRNFSPFGAWVARLEWWPLRTAEFGLWQPLTRVVVQGMNPIGVLIALLVLYFFLPTLEVVLSKRQLAEAAVGTFLGSSGLGLVLDGLGVVGFGPAMGWAFVVTGSVVLFGLSHPRATINLFFVLPVPAGIIVWGSGLLALVFLLASPGLATAAHMGGWGGALGWWFLRGPGARRRKLKARGRQVERELRRFTVLDGGREKPQSGGNDDDWIH